MKSTEEWRFLKRYFAWICLAALLAGAAFGWYASSRQSYTAQASLSFGEESAPDASEIFSEANIREAFRSYGLSLDFDAVRSGGSVTEDSNTPGELTVSLTLDNSTCSSTENVRLALDAILNCYFSHREGQNAAAVPASAEHIFEAEHDYIEQAERLVDFTNTILAKLDECASLHPEFVSASSGCTLHELAEEYRSLRDSRLVYVLSDILQCQLTKDRDVLLKKYSQRVASPQDRTAAQTALDRQVLAAFQPAEETAIEEPDAAAEPETQAAASETPAEQALDVQVVQSRVESELSALQAKLQELHPTMLAALREYDASCSTDGVSILSPVTAAAQVPVWLYALLGAAGVLLLGCCLALCAARIRELWSCRH